MFEALAHPARRHILILLAALGGELPSGYLAKRFAHSWPTTTRHLNVLVEAGLVDVTREGRSSRYRVKRDDLRRVVSGWLEQLEPYDPNQRWTPSGRRTSR